MRPSIIRCVLLVLSQSSRSQRDHDPAKAMPVRTKVFLKLYILFNLCVLSCDFLIYPKQDVHYYGKKKVKQISEMQFCPV